MSPMMPVYVDEGIIEPVDKAEVVTDECIVRVRRIP